MYLSQADRLKHQQQQLQ
jgi:16S rRNA C1402 (ribose-2'-O) methylase RsmI